MTNRKYKIKNGSYCIIFIYIDINIYIYIRYGCDLLSFSFFPSVLFVHVSYLYISYYVYIYIYGMVYINYFITHSFSRRPKNWNHNIDRQ